MKLFEGKLLLLKMSTLFCYRRLKLSVSQQLKVMSEVSWNLAQLGYSLTHTSPIDSVKMVKYLFMPLFTTIFTN